jgi:antitoxin (DNA-binding transcriptional repressor) of toxin-antitoxin stability system
VKEAPSPPFSSQEGKVERFFKATLAYAIVVVTEKGKPVAEYVAARGRRTGRRTPTKSSKKGIEFSVSVLPWGAREAQARQKAALRQVVNVLPDRYARGRRRRCP